VWGYCLMTNHVHFVVVPEQETSLARTFGGVHSDYARYWNLLHGKNGHLWQGRFYSCPLERTQAWHALAYVERNPVRAGLVDDARIYRWSSAAPHCEGLRSAITIDEHDWQQVYTRARWSKVLTAGVSQEALDDRLRAATMSGSPLGSTKFVERLGHLLGRDLERKPVGRPRKLVMTAVA
jgi:putative transposase